MRAAPCIAELNRPNFVLIDDVDVERVYDWLLRSGKDAAPARRFVDSLNREISFAWVFSQAIPTPSERKKWNDDAIKAVYRLLTLLEPVRDPTLPRMGLSAKLYDDLSEFRKMCERSIEDNERKLARAISRT